MSRKKSTATVSPVVPVPATPPAVSVAVQPLALNINDAAKLVGVRPFTLREAIGSGSLAAKQAGRTYIIRLDDLNHWIDSLNAVPLQPCFVKRQQQREAGAA
jgi:excisionase family DNA binding protein